MCKSDKKGNRYSSYKAKCDFVLQELSLLIPVVTLHEIQVIYSKREIEHL